MVMVFRPFQQLVLVKVLVWAWKEESKKGKDEIQGCRVKEEDF